MHIIAYHLLDYILMNSVEVSHENVLSTKVKQYTICQLLGSGVSSNVYLAINNDTGKEVAMKVIPKDYLNKDKKLMELVKTEIYILKTCNNENIVKCYDVFQSVLSIFLVMEYCNGLDMEEYIRNKKYLSEDNAVWFLKQILNGFKGMHEIGAMHRDFKLANLLLHDRICKIADLGFAKQMKQQDLTQTILGTQITMAPEILEGKPYGMSADIWSLGVVFYQMITGKYPYMGADKNDLLKNIKSKQNDVENLRVSPLAKNFIQGCLTTDPLARITWVQIYNHPLLNKKTVELTYGISKMSDVFFENQKFYRKQTLDESQESLVMLRNSARKELIIEQINKIQCKASQCDAIFRNSTQAAEATRCLITYGINYGTYLNQLSYPLKFFSLELLHSIPNVDHFTPLYLIYKKSYYQIRDFHHVVQKRRNIFEINLLWNQFINCSIYNDVICIVSHCLERAEQLYHMIQAAVKNSKYFDPNSPVALEMARQEFRRQQFTDLLESYKKAYLHDLQQVLFKAEKQQNIDLIDLCQALLYYSDMKPVAYFSTDKSGTKRKISPQRFDWNHSKAIVYKQIRLELLQKFNAILNS